MKASTFIFYSHPGDGGSGPYTSATAPEARVGLTVHGSRLTVTVLRIFESCVSCQWGDLNDLLPPVPVPLSTAASLTWKDGMGTFFPREARARAYMIGAGSGLRVFRSMYTYIVGTYNTIRYTNSSKSLSDINLLCITCTT